MHIQIEFENSAIFYIIARLKIIWMQIALRKITRNFPRSLLQAISARNNLTTTGKVVYQQQIFTEEHRKRSGLLRKVGFGFVSIALPFKATQARVNVEEFLAAHQLEFLEGPTVFKMKYCPFCNKPHHNDRTNLYTLNINKDAGYFHCFRCSTKGSWLQFRERILGFTQEMFEHLEEDAAIPYTSSSPPSVKETKMSDAQFFFYRSNMQKEEYKDVVEYLHQRGFKDETIAAYNLGAGTEEFYDTEGNKAHVKCIYFPAYKILQEDEQKQAILNEFKRESTSQCHYNNNWTEIVRLKVRGAGKQNKKYMRQLPAGAQKGFFGLNLIKDSDNTVVLTEGEFDAMAVYQQTGIPALSLPQGASNLSEGFLPYLKRFEKIVLWMDNDDAGALNTSKMVEKLGVNRTAIVRHSFAEMKDANDFLLSAPNRISELVHKARTIPDSSLLSFSALRDSIFAKISKTEENNGLKVSWLPFFNKVVKGLRMGELTVVSGPTGSGKTTLLSQITLDLCKKDITVLWGSFEIRNEILITSMMYQFADLRLDKRLEKYEHFADKFSRLPLHFMDFYGSHSIEKILSTIIYSIEKHNVHVVVIDTLQFLLSQQGDGFKKFELQDTLMARLRDITIRYNVHVVVVIHPRKTDDGEDIGIHSIYGTSKATQQADNIWLIQNRENFKLFDVRKNRYDGELGRIPLGFNRNSKNFFQLTKDEFQALRAKEKTMSDLVHAREQMKASEPEKTEAEKQYDSIFEDEIMDTDLNRVRKNTTFNNFRPQQQRE